MITLDKILLEWSYRCYDGVVNINDPKKVNILNEILNELGIDDAEEITEVNLSPTQLEKPFSKQSEFNGQYQDRGEKFLEKILQGEEFELIDGSKIKIDIKSSSDAIELLKNKKYKSLGGGNQILVDIEGNKHSLSHFKKTNEFGSGKGSGGGSLNTSIQESTQCVINAIAYKIKSGSISKEDITDKNIEDAVKFVDVTSSIEEMKSFLQNESWIPTFINTANALLSSYPNSNFEFHRGSKFVNNIYNSYKTASKKQEILMQPDKWNPADIWLVDTSIKGINFPIKLDELNNTIIDLLSSGKLIGVSLKKISGTPELSLYNISKEDVEGYTFEEVISSNKSKEARIKYNDGVVAFRTFNFTTNFAGEIQGKTASHGKVGMGAINDALKLNNLPPLPSTQETKSSFESNNPENIIKDFMDIYNKIVEPISDEEFINLFNSKDMDWKVSKYLSIKLGDIVKTNIAKQDEFISDLIRYASSSTKISSAFLKVS